MGITVQLFARARELAGSSTITLERVANVAELRSRLAEQFPAMVGLLERSAIAVNHDFADDSRELKLDDEIAIIPPVSGG